MQLSTATRCLNRRSTQFKPCLQRIGEANCVEGHPRTKTIHRCCHHCHAAAAAAAVAVGVGLKFADDVNFVVGMHRATSRATTGGLVWSIVTAVHGAEGLPHLCRHCSHLVVSSSTVDAPMRGCSWRIEGKREEFLYV